MRTYYYHVGVLTFFRLRAGVNVLHFAEKISVNRYTGRLHVEQVLL